VFDYTVVTKSTSFSGRDCDFHSLRHTFVTNLALAGVHPVVAQKLARHYNIQLTMKYYTHVLHKSEVEAINALQNLIAKQNTKKTKRTA
jgi:integrase